MRNRDDDAGETGGRGDFFAVDRAAWWRVVELGLNPSVAYLVLARFTNRANRVSHASVQAIEKHTSISRGRARKAIDVLLSPPNPQPSQGRGRPARPMPPVTLFGEKSGRPVYELATCSGDPNMSFRTRSSPARQTRCLRSSW